MTEQNDHDRLMAKARNCRDNARAEEVVAHYFRANYLAGLSGSPTASRETHARSMELYDFVIGGEHRARDFLADAELFERAAAALDGTPCP